MSSHFSLRARWTAIASPTVRWRGWAMAGAWIVAIVLASLLTSWLSDRVWAAAAVVAVGMALAASHLIKTLEALRAALDRTERARAALELALRQSQKAAALGRLTVGVAHDFNNHLTVISSNIEMAAHLLDGRAERSPRHLDAAMQGVRRAAALTGRLVSFSREVVPEPEPVDVHRLVGGLSDLLRRTMGGHVGVDVILAKEPWFTWADMAQMENALLSMAVHVSDRMPDGVNLIIAVSNVHSCDNVIATSGPELPPGDCVQIILGAEADERRWLPADDISSAELTMARAFVREAAGAFQRSEAAAVAFRLLLPRYVPPRFATAAGRDGTDRRPTILVVEDDAELREVCAKMLRELGYHVCEAPDAMEAITRITDFGGVDLLFADLGLPGGVSGCDLADAAHNADAGIQVLFTTGQERIELPERVTAALLRKPFSPTQLADKVREILADGRHRVLPPSGRS